MRLRELSEKLKAKNLFKPAIWLSIAILTLLVIFITEGDIMAKKGNPGRSEESEAEILNIIEDNSFIQNNPQIIESSKEIDDVIKWAMDLGLIKKGDIVWRIIKCESNFDPIACNHESYSKGMGLFQIITSTWNSTIEKMKREKAYLPEKCDEKIYPPISLERTEAIFDPECNVFVGLYLYRTKGTEPWGTAETEWGSWSCWNK